MSMFYRTVTVSVVGDPAMFATTLAAAGIFDQSVVYERTGSWWFAGGARFTVRLYRDRVVTTHPEGERTSPVGGEPLRVLAAALDGLPVDGWRAYGWAAFELGHAVAGANPFGAAPGEADQPLVHLIVPAVELVVRDATLEVRAADQRSLDQVLSFVAGLDPSKADHGARRPSRPVDVHPGGYPGDPDAESYGAAVSAATARIQAGALTKVILSRRLSVPFEVDFPATCLRGRQANTPARTFLLDLPGLRTTGFSPETVVEVAPDGAVATRPLAGTRARGLGTTCDARNRAELYTDSKEVHEHAISVKLAVEELHAVCEPDSVAVRGFMDVEPRGSVQHLASYVTGQLRADRTGWDALAALFPAVTASGIPKAAAFGEIAAFEREPRGIYAGAVLQAGSDGFLDAALVLRAVIATRGRTWLQAGAGIVADSTPQREYTETCEKLASIAPHLVPVDFG